MKTVLRNKVFLVLCLLGCKTLFAQDTLPYNTHTFGVDILPNFVSTGYSSALPNKYLIDVYATYNFPQWIVRGNIGFSSNFSDLKTRDLYYRIGINYANNDIPGWAHFEPGICYMEGWRQESLNIVIQDALYRTVSIPEVDVFHYRALGIELAASVKLTKRFAFRPSFIIGALVTRDIPEGRLNKGISGFGIISHKETNPTFLSISFHLTYGIIPVVKKRYTGREFIYR